MKSYIDLIQQTFEFPTMEFNVDKMNCCSTMYTDGHHQGTWYAFETNYLPKIGEHIGNANMFFQNAFKRHNYKGTYTYCYCNKSSHFSFVLEEALKHNIHLETSSSFDILLSGNCIVAGKSANRLFILANGYKRPLYTQYLSELIMRVLM